MVHPLWVGQSVGAEVYKKMLRMQNEFLANFRMVPVFGITPKALKHVFNAFDDDDNERQTTVENYILGRNYVRGIETTNRAEDLGKFFLITDAAGVLEARAFVDNVIKELF